MGMIIEACDGRLAVIDVSRWGWPQDLARTLFETRSEPKVVASQLPKVHSSIKEYITLLSVGTIFRVTDLQSVHGGEDK